MFKLNYGFLAESENCRRVFPKEGTGESADIVRRVGPSGAVT